MVLEVMGLNKVEKKEIELKIERWEWGKRISEGGGSSLFWSFL